QALAPTFELAGAAGAAVAQARRQHLRRRSHLRKIARRSDPRLLVRGHERQIMYVHMVTVRIYTTDYCSYCSAAKQLLGARSVSFEEIDCTKDPETRKWLVDTTGRKTVPQIFIADVPIGGFDDLKALDTKGERARIH